MAPVKPGRLRKEMALWLLVALTFFHPGASFYMPGVAPTEYKAGDSVPVMGVKLTSTRTQLPMEYYSLPFCKPKENVVYSTENLGEVLRGDRIVNTLYNFRMKVNETCVFMCHSELAKKSIDTLHKRIEQDYHVHLLIDNLPVATPFPKFNGRVVYDYGYQLGQFVPKKKQSIIHNHIHFTVKYHDLGDSARVVGFEAMPTSLNLGVLNRKNKVDDITGNHQCTRSTSSNQFPQQIIDKSKSAQEIMFTYGVVWQKSDIQWASRWDIYLTMDNVQIHWFAILNSIVVVFFLAGVLAVIIIRTLRRDIAKYNQDEDIEDALEESGWKLVHGDVFRPPRLHMFLSALIGSGVQLIAMTTVIISFAMLGMLSPASRGALMTAAIFLYVAMGIVAGFYAGRLYKTLKGQKWKRAALMTSTMFPGFILGSGFFLNFFIWGKASSGAVPATTMIALLALWLGVSLPLVFCGFFFGYRKQPYDHPVRTNQIPRQVPAQPWFLSPIPAALMAGILPFGAMFIELFFVFSAIWQNQFYYLFGFLFLVYVILIISCSQISIVMVYFQLCAEDYHWWWQSFIVSGGSSIYILAYSVFYYFTKMQIMGFIPTLLYFGYSTIMAITFWILTGTIGFFAAYFFIRRIYGAIKID